MKIDTNHVLNEMVDEANENGTDSSMINGKIVTVYVVSNMVHWEMEAEPISRNELERVLGSVSLNLSQEVACEKIKIAIEKELAKKHTFPNTQTTAQFYGMSLTITMYAGALKAEWKSEDTTLNDFQVITNIAKFLAKN